jgi:hypothetical protein
MFIMIKKKILASMALVGWIGLTGAPGKVLADVQTVNVVSVGGQGSNMVVLSRITSEPVRAALGLD